MIYPQPSLCGHRQTCSESLERNLEDKDKKLLFLSCPISLQLPWRDLTRPEGIPTPRKSWWCPLISLPVSFARMIFGSRRLLIFSWCFFVIARYDFPTFGDWLWIDFLSSKNEERMNKFCTATLKYFYTLINSSGSCGGENINQEVIFSYRAKNVQSCNYLLKQSGLVIMLFDYEANPFSPLHQMCLKLKSCSVLCGWVWEEVKIWSWHFCPRRRR